MCIRDSRCIVCATQSNWVKMWFSCFPVLPGSAEAQVTWNGTVMRLLIAYFIGNISAEKYQNPFMCVKGIASQRWDIFETRLLKFDFSYRYAAFEKISTDIDHHLPLVLRTAVQHLTMQLMGDLFVTDNGRYWFRQSIFYFTEQQDKIIGERERADNMPFIKIRGNFWNNPRINTKHYRTRKLNR